MNYDVGPRHREKELKHSPDKGRAPLAEEEVVYDTADRPLLPHEMEPAMRRKVEGKLDGTLRQQAKDVVTTHLEITGDMDVEWDRLVGQMIRFSSLVESMRDNARENEGVSTTPIRNAEKQLKLVRFQLEALADIRARQSLLADLAEGRDPKDMLHQAGQSKDLHVELMGTKENVAEKIGGAAMLILRRAEQRMLKDVVENPQRVEVLQKDQKKLMDKTMKRTGGTGGTHDASYTPSKKISAAEGKLRDFQTRMKKVQEHIQSLSWFERTFGQGKILKKRLVEMQRERKVVQMDIAAETVGRALGQRDSKPLTKKRFDVPELTDASVEPLENTWQLYQAELASLNSLQEKRAALSKWPWKDRAEKVRLAELIGKTEDRAKELKAQHAQEIREKNLAREQEQDELRKKMGM